MADSEKNGGWLLQKNIGAIVVAALISGGGAYGVGSIDRSALQTDVESRLRNQGLLQADVRARLLVMENTMNEKTSDRFRASEAERAFSDLHRRLDEARSDANQFRLDLKELSKRILVCETRLKNSAWASP